MSEARGEHDYNIFLTLTPLSGPQEALCRSQAWPTTPTRALRLHRLPAPDRGGLQLRRQERKGKAAPPGKVRAEGRGERGKQVQLARFWVSVHREVEVVVEVTGGWVRGPWRSHSAISPSTQFQGHRWKGSYSPGVAQRGPCPALGACLSTGGSDGEADSSEPREQAGS